MDKKEVFVDVSARHIHLTREDQDVLFGKGYELEVYKELAGGGGFASVEQIAIVGPRSTFPKVRILGPCRKQSQVEVSKTDARALGVDAPVRLSGDLEGTPGIKLVGPAGEIELKNGVIVAKRHIHIGAKQVKEWGLKTGDIVAVKVETPDRSLIFGDTEIRVQDEEDLALMHIDTDEANAAGMRPMNGFIVKF
ncbi:MAG: phosphate propanoyltransferase [Mogibacterium sp.]|nr:phosphate propanoyltransferase [Mogibacterium sp.]MBQ3370508.1 phosphate propanoyltransferase [Mogibacterium sp.]